MATLPPTAAHLRAPLAIIIAALIGMVPVVVCALASTSAPSAEIGR